ncbi:NPC intracellular cholesterol transporter 2 [Neocloeon triangulifer]|uniref:NPC intracellular cholesterol transporter 2 n=1 Tax=Neocloeon triangulifer TaxID=2078957 RepID=UPI00286F9CC3|nr:NPC intracellular cholesterol transporter 2 [Neocloeon triangulifer]
MSSQLVLISLLIFAASAASVSFEDCGSLYSLDAVDIDGCDVSTEPCPLLRGQEVNVTIRFQSGFRSEQLRPNVFITQFNVDTHLVVTPDDCRALLYPVCPIVPGQNALYKAKLVVSPNLALIEGTLTWKLHSDSTQNLICMRTEVIIGPEVEPHGKGF